MSGETVVIGTYTSGGGSRGIYAAEWDGAGVLGTPRLLAEMKNPSFVAPHPSLPLLYAASETGRFEGRDSGAVAVVRPGSQGAVTVLLRDSGGTSPCHVAVDPRGGFLVVSNYGSGSAAVFPLVDGVPGDPVAVMQFEGHGPDPKRQEGPHAHSAFFDPTGDRFYVQDLGTDRIYGFALDRAARSVRPLDPPFFRLAAGSGPRHMAFHPGGPRAYVINELDNTVTALGWDRETGALAPLQTVNALPADASGPSYCADIHVSSDGAFLYGSNRGHDSIAAWRIGPEKGGLALVQHVSCGGKHPRSFCLSPDNRWLLCANMDSDNIVVFRRDPSTGMLTRTADISASKPVCLLFLPFRPGGRPVSG
jgi:6-phosphogluconolactonase